MEEEPIIKKSTYTPTQKLRIYKWRIENKELHKLINRRGNATYYEKNREKVIKAVLDRRRRKKEMETLGEIEGSDIH